MARAFALFVVFSVAGAASAQDPTPDEAALMERLDAVGGSTFASTAEGTLDQARGALARARTLRESGDVDAAERAEAIARAATELAERQVARALESSERQLAARRLSTLRERLERAVAALQRVRERASEDAEAEDAAEAAAEAAAAGDEEAE